MAQEPDQQPQLEKPVLVTPALPTAVDNIANNAKLLEICIAESQKTILPPDKFLESFSVNTIMTALEAVSGLRGRIMVRCIKMPDKMAPKLSVVTCIDNLQTALAEGDTTPAEILQALIPEDIVRYFTWSGLAKYLFATYNWWGPGDDISQKKAISFVIEIIRQAISLECLSYDQLRDWMGVDVLTKSLLSRDSELLRQVTEAALKFGADGRPFTSDDLFTLVSPDSDLFPTLMTPAAFHEKVLLRLVDYCGWNRTHQGYGKIQAEAKAKKDASKTIRPMGFQGFVPPLTKQQA